VAVRRATVIATAMAAASVAASVAATGCPGGGGSKSRPGDAGKGSDSKGSDVRDAGGHTDAAATGGGVEVRVEWKGAAAAVRTSPGRNPCRVARRGRARVHTLWGVAGAVVILDAPGAPTKSAPVMLTVTDCEVTPSVAVAPDAPTTIRIYDADQRRHVVLIEPVVAFEQLAEAPVEAAGKDAVRAVLAWAGAEVEVAAPGAGAIGVATEDTPEDVAWVVVAPPTGRVGITDDTGAVGFDAVPVGTHAVTAWLPPAAGEKAKLVNGTVTIEAGRTTKITIDVAAGTVRTTPPPPYSAGSGIAPGSGQGSGSATGDGDDDDDDDDAP
jgi:hypothetical protein